MLYRFRKYIETMCSNMLGVDSLFFKYIIILVILVSVKYLLGDADSSIIRLIDSISIGVSFLVIVKLFSKNTIKNLIKNNTHKRQVKFRRLKHDIVSNHKVITCKTCGRLNIVDLSISTKCPLCQNLVYKPH